MITYIEKGVGLHAAITAAGYALGQYDGVWIASQSGQQSTTIDSAVQTIINNYDPLPDYRAAQNTLLLSAYSVAAFSTISYMSTVFQCDPTSVATLNGVLTVCVAAGTTPSGFYWVDAQNNQVAMTLAQLQGLAAVIMSNGWTQFQKLQSLKGQVASATSQAAIEAVVW